MKVVVDQDKCVGSGQCVMLSEAVFDQRDEDGVVVLLQENPTADQHEAVRESARVCPALAIEVEE
ncbi:ferredoxin [Nocardia macrotermitis]|uniref:Ferredoxin n=1 Tax=Nocardia macrotermitis TaxID=2585198 RepID=A0A7K0D312_9NOCA|nr:ferredoxin [Nocardia macrotermitis]MQY20116.1 Ferredoxin-2 [Nocardia macrotermitis]